MAERLLERIVAPHIILPLILLLLLAVALLSPEALNEEARLTTHSIEARGARGLYETATRLGWNVSRRETEFGDSLDRNATYALLAPSMRLSIRETRMLLTAVREGASLLYVHGGRSAVLDSLGLTRTGSFTSTVLPDAGVLAGIATPDCPAPVLGQPTGLDLLSSTVMLRDSLMRDTVTFVLASGFTARRVVAVGMPLGRGRVLVVTEPAMFRNDVVRMCSRKEGVLAVRMLGWLAEPVGNSLVFDEYHHGYGPRDDVRKIIIGAVTGSATGRMVLQVGVAAIVLLLAVAPRPIPPRPRQRIERRSPFEHVGALARAYEKVGATRRATKLFVRGLRRRHDAAAWRHGSDEEYLRAVAERYPSLAHDTRVTGAAMKEVRTPADFLEVGRAVERIERKLSSDNR